MCLFWQEISVCVCMWNETVIMTGICGGSESVLPVGIAWSKGCMFEFWQGRQENFLLQSQLCVLTLILCLFHPCVTAVAHKRPWSFCKKCRWQVTPKHAYTLTQRSRCGLTVQALCGSLSENKPTPTCQGTFSHSNPSSLSRFGLILA